MERFEFTASPWPAVLGLAASLAGASAPEGPGLPNKTWPSSQVGKPIALIKSREGHGSVAMHRGYLVVIYSKDSGEGSGGFAFLDLSDPTQPVVAHDEDTPETRDIREPHGWGMRGDIACLQAIGGMQFWDWSDIDHPKLLSYLKLPDIRLSDYDKGMWWTCWQGRYVYGGGSGNGLYIVDAADPAKPVHVKTIPIRSLGGFRVGPTFAIGNLLVLSSTDMPGIATLDIGDPLNPRIIATSKDGVSYASMVNGNRILGSGSEGDLGKLLVYDITDPSEIIRFGNSALMGDKGGYPMFSDGFGFSGFSAVGFGKFDITRPDIPLIQRGTGGVPGSDQDFCTALGNLAFAGSDNAGGSGLIPHQAEPDTAGPAVNMVVPKDGAIKQPLGTRVGLTFTDLLDKATLTPSNIMVRPVGGEAIPGQLATQTGILNFSPDSLLLPNTTYEVLVREGGIRDYAGNAVPAGFRSEFTTGPDPREKPRAKPGISPMPRPERPGIFIRYPGLPPIDISGEARGRWVDIQGRFLPIGKSRSSGANVFTPGVPDSGAGEAP